jgi:hypothetical protein
VASTVTAVIMFVIAMIPLVGQIVAAIIAIIDALIAAACAIASAIEGEDVQENVWGEIACRGLTGSISYLINWFIYGATILVDLERSDRLVFGGFDHTFVRPELGASVGNHVQYSAALTNTINLAKLPVDWKAASYAWQFNDDNLKSATFEYEWQTEEQDLHVDEDGNDLIDLNEQSPSMGIRYRHAALLHCTDRNKRRILAGQGGHQSPPASVPGRGLRRPRPGVLRGPQPCRVLPRSLGRLRLLGAGLLRPRRAGHQPHGPGEDLHL